LLVRAGTARVSAQARLASPPQTASMACDMGMPSTRVESIEAFDTVVTKRPRRKRLADRDADISEVFDQGRRSHASWPGVGPAIHALLEPVFR
jgi:hypothetical protein